MYEMKREYLFEKYSFGIFFLSFLFLNIFRRGPGPTLLQITGQCEEGFDVMDSSTLL